MGSAVAYKNGNQSAFSTLKAYAMMLNRSKVEQLMENLNNSNKVSLILDIKYLQVYYSIPFHWKNLND